MQTFLPYPDFRESLRCLDYRRCGKQRVEAYQIIGTLRNGSRWRNHPAVLMWKDNIEALMLYYNVSLEVWREKGFNNIKLEPFPCSPTVRMPAWLGLDVFHASHRSNLLRKLPEHYGRFGWKEGPGLEYYWPTNAAEVHIAERLLGKQEAVGASPTGGSTKQE